MDQQTAVPGAIPSRIHPKTPSRKQAKRSHDHSRRGLAQETERRTVRAEPSGTPPLPPIIMVMLNPRAPRPGFGDSANPSSVAPPSLAVRARQAPTRSPGKPLSPRQQLAANARSTPPWALACDCTPAVGNR
ncbi:MAG: hypothetical protein KatS3mg103_1168 [Phycisphaerales bacterium]|nr:MAG: hypothetical protein KatS3mg103_1168 [Phycisphaerales bacterium]